MITSAMCRSYKKELLEGVHDFRADQIYLALFTSAADLGPDTATYTSTGEASGPGYVPGGIPLAVSAGYPAIVNGHGVVAFDPASIPSATIQFRGVLIYNRSKGNRAIKVVDRGVDVVHGPGPLSFFSSSSNPYLILNA
jgi:hypothetical protein